MGPKNYVLDGGPDLPHDGAFLRGTCASPFPIVLLVCHFLLIFVFSYFFLSLFFMYSLFAVILIYGELS